MGRNSAVANVSKAHLFDGLEKSDQATQQQVFSSTRLGSGFGRIEGNIINGGSCWESLFLFLNSVQIFTAKGSGAFVARQAVVAFLANNANWPAIWKSNAWASKGVPKLAWPFNIKTFGGVLTEDGMRVCPDLGGEHTFFYASGDLYRFRCSPVIFALLNNIHKHGCSAPSKTIAVRSC